MKLYQDKLWKYSKFRLILKQMKVCSCVCDAIKETVQKKKREYNTGSSKVCDDGSKLSKVRAVLRQGKEGNKFSDQISKSGKK